MLVKSVSEPAGREFQRKTGDQKKKGLKNTEDKEDRYLLA